MSISVSEHTAPTTQRLSGARHGPTLLCVGALHGNEPAGAEAIRRIVTAVRREGPLARGDLVTVVANPVALISGKRYVDRDLNRSWTDVRVRNLRRHGPQAVEDQLTLDLAKSVDRTIEDARGALYLLDLHTTSGASPPFCNAIDRLASRRFSLTLRAPTVLGIEEQLDGTLVDWLDRRGFTGTVFESGQHDDPRSSDHAEAALWLALGALGMIDPASPLARRVLHAERLLERVVANLPKMVELTYRHALDDRTAFEMLPGFTSFQEIAAGDLLAHELENPVYAPSDGRILMPLYQAQGDEGFFLMSDYGAHLRVASLLLRRSGLLRAVPALPGVDLDPDRPGWLLLRKAAREGAVRALLRLFGYRRERVERGVVRLSR